MDASFNAVLEESLSLAPVEVKVYKRRWWILMLFAGLGFMQCSVWNTWGPITNSAEYAFPTWSDGTIALLSMWGSITMFVGIIPFTVGLQKYAMRKSILLTSGLLATSTIIRLFSHNDTVFTIFAHIGSVLNGFAGIIIGIAPSLLSSLWFPPNERTTATAVGCTFNQLGNAGGFFLGPWIVDDPDNSTTPEILKEEINKYLWIVAGLCLSLFLGVLIYFPDKPKKPPSPTGALPPRKGSTLNQSKMILKNGNFWLLVIPYSLTVGINVAWSSVIDINVAPTGISQVDASYMGVYVTFGGVLMALIVSRVTDLVFGYIKVTILILLSIATLGFIWFLLIMNGCLAFSKLQLFASAIIGSSFSYGCSPLFFELAVELAYPVPEAIVGGCLNMGWNLISVLFLIILQGGMKNVLWMDYILAIQGIVAIAALIFVKEEYRRTHIDRAVATRPPDEEEESLLGESTRTALYSA